MSDVGTASLLLSLLLMVLSASAQAQEMTFSCKSSDQCFFGICNNLTSQCQCFEGYKLENASGCRFDWSQADSMLSDIRWVTGSLACALAVVAVCSITTCYCFDRRHIAKTPKFGPVIPSARTLRRRNLVRLWTKTAQWAGVIFFIAILFGLIFGSINLGDYFKLSSVIQRMNVTMATVISVGKASNLCSRGPLCPPGDFLVALNVSIVAGEYTTQTATAYLESDWRAYPEQLQLLLLHEKYQNGSSIPCWYYSVAASSVTSASTTAYILAGSQEFQAMGPLLTSKPLYCIAVGAGLAGLSVVTLIILMVRLEEFGLWKLPIDEEELEPA